MRRIRLSIVVIIIFVSIYARLRYPPFRSAAPMLHASALAPRGKAGSRWIIASRLPLARMHNASFIDQGHCVIVIKHVRARSMYPTYAPATWRASAQQRAASEARARDRERERKRESPPWRLVRRSLAGYFHSVAVRPRRMFTVVP